MRISDWSSDVCSSDLGRRQHRRQVHPLLARAAARDLTRLLPELKIALWLIMTQAYRSRQRRQGRAPPFGPIARGVAPPRLAKIAQRRQRSEEHTSELQSLMRISYAVFCLKKKKKNTKSINTRN